MTARRALAVLPGVGASLLPKLTCPLCAPAYAGLLTTIGLGFLISERNLLFFIAAFLSLSVAALTFRARQRRGYSPAIVGMVAAAIMLIGKFSIQSAATMYAGLALFVASSIWNSWPRRLQIPCPQCAPEGHGLIQLSANERSYESKTKN